MNNENLTFDFTRYIEQPLIEVKWLINVEIMSCINPEVHTDPKKVIKAMWKMSGYWFLITKGYEYGVNEDGELNFQFKFWWAEIVDKDGKTYRMKRTSGDFKAEFARIYATLE